MSIVTKMDIDLLKVVDLKVKLKELGLSQYGNKAELVKRLKDHFYAPPTDADDSDSSDDESSGLVVQKDQKNLDDTDQLSEYDNAEDNENEYDNENGEDNESGESEAPSNKRSRGKIYAPFASFKSLDSAFLALQSEWLDGNWKRGNCAPGVRATTIWYKCKQCTLSLKLMVTKDESKRCTLWAEDKFDSSGNLLHEHDDTATQAKDRGIPQHVKAKLIFFDSLHIKPKAMIEQLRSDGFVPPTMTQVNNFLKHHRKKNLGETKFCLQDLVDLATKPCLQRQSVDPASAVQPPGIDDEPEETEPVPTTKKRNTTTSVEQRTSKRQRKNWKHFFIFFFLKLFLVLLLFLLWLLFFVLHYSFK